MPGRRSTTAVPMDGPADATTVTVKLPPYEPLSHPFRMDTIIGLEKTERRYNNDHWKPLEDQYRTALELLSECGEQINGLVKNREDDIAQSSAPQDEETIALRKIEDDVNKMTDRMDTHVRKTIDAIAGTERTKQAWVDVVTEQKARKHAEVEARETRAAARRARGELDGEGAEDEEVQPPDPETAPSVVFKKILEEGKEKYELQSLNLRYAQHNDYVDFKRSVFEARHGQDAGIPHHSTWFNERGGSPLPGAAMEADDSEDDIQLTREKISTKCPLTLMEFKEPISNRICKHVYEKSAFEEYVKDAPWAAVPGRGVVKFTKACPKAGCAALINLKDLYEDKAVIRRIRRVQAYNAKSQTQAQELDEVEEAGWGKVDEEDEDEDDNDEDAMDED